MKFVGILVEGQTEERFVQRILNPYLQSKEIFLTATIVKTYRGDTGSFKGGGRNYEKIEQDLKFLFHNTGNIATTTMFDLYGLPSDFPKRQETAAQSKKGVTLAEYLEEKWQEQFPKQRNFIPYLSVHEFEALLFSEPKTVALNFPDLPNLAAQELQKIYDAYENPESINLNNPPARRIVHLIPTYRKRFDGIPIAEKIGISKMREECPHFDAWLKKLESLQDQ